MGKIHYDYWYDTIRPGKVIRPVEYLKKECYYFSEEWQREIEVLAVGIVDRGFDWGLIGMVIRFITGLLTQRS